MANSHSLTKSDEIHLLVEELIAKCKTSPFAKTPESLLQQGQNSSKEFDDYKLALNKSNIVEVDKNFKSVSSSSVLNSYLLLVDRYHKELGAIKITEFKGHIAGIGPAAYMITFDNPNKNTKTYFYVREDPKNRIAKCYILPSLFSR